MEIWRLEGPMPKLEPDGNPWKKCACIWYCQHFEGTFAPALQAAVKQRVLCVCQGTPKQDFATYTYAWGNIYLQISWNNNSRPPTWRCPRSVHIHMTSCENRSRGKRNRADGVFFEVIARACQVWFVVLKVLCVLCDVCSKWCEWHILGLTCLVSAVK